MAYPRKAPDKGALRLYRSYNFIDKDPAIDKLRTIVKDEGLSYTEIQYLSGVNTNTMHQWFAGKTRTPQHRTLAAVAAALGYDWELVHSKQVNYEREVPKAKAEYQHAHGGNGHGKPRRK